MFFSRLLQEKRNAAAALSLRNPPEIFQKIFGGGITNAGVNVNEDKALSLTAVWSAIMKISRTMGVFPLPTYRRLAAGGKERAANHPLYNLLHNNPCPGMTASTWRFIMASHQLLWGAGIAEIEIDPAGKITALKPLPPWRVRPAETVSGERVYEYTSQKGQIRTLWPWQLLIFPFYATLDGGWLSPVAVHRETFGSALAVREFGALSFSQGAKVSGVVTGIEVGDEESEDSFKEAFDAKYTGLKNAGNVLLLPKGLEYERISIPANDAQYLETRKFDVAEVARIYDVPLFMLQDHDKSSSWAASTSVLKDSFISLTLAPYCVQWEQEFNAKLFANNDEYYCKFTMDGLLRGDVKDRMEAYKTGAQMGIYDINEIREMEDRNPLPDEIGKARIVPLNMGSLENVVKGETNNVDKIVKTKLLKLINDVDKGEDDNGD